MPRLLSHSILLMAMACAACGPKPTPPAPPAKPDPPISYSAEIRPILAAQCFSCHGQHSARNKSGVRLDTRQHATTIRPESGGQPIFPGDLRRSSLLHKLFAVDPAAAQAPTDATHTVTREHYDLLQRWITQGANYEPHWAFQPLLAEIPLPDTAASTWPRFPLDQFILANLKRAAPASTPQDWLQRTARDLTGLPPDPALRAAFEQTLLTDGEEAAMRDEALDELLASPAFGEHMATIWLQHARYSDDLAPNLPNGQSPYRDWVVKAFNANLPLDQFLTAQLAGDLLPNPTRDHLLATAFNRLHPLGTTSADPVYESAAKRTESFARAMLGLDFRCAKCHEHPYDPLPPADYNALLSFFDGIGERPLPPTPGIISTPSILVPTPEQAEQLLAVTLAETNAINALAEATTVGEQAFSDWLANPEKLPLISDLLAAFTFDETGDRSPNRILGGTGHALHTGLPPAPGIRGKALTLDGQNPVLFPDLFLFDRSDAFTFAFWLQLPTLPEHPVTLLSRRETDGRGLQLLLSEGHLAARLVRSWPGNALGIHASSANFTPGTWHQIVWSYDGSSTAAGLRLHLDGLPLESTTTAASIWKELLIDDSTPLQVGNDPDLQGALLDDLQVFSRALTPLEIANLFDGRSLTEAIAADDPDQLRPYYFSSINPETRQLRRSLPALRRAVVAAESPLPEVSIMREAFVPSHPRATPPFLPDFHPNADPPTRLDLAHWLTEPSHPLTARVLVNRLWANFFGHGLVATDEDFGLHGAAPTNPALLDWMARDLIDHNWDLKRLCRQIVLSAAYRQTQQRLADPIRLRDQILAATALLGAETADGPITRSLYSTWPLPPAPDSPSDCPSSPTAPPPLTAPAPLSDVEEATVIRLITTTALQEAPPHDAGRLTLLLTAIHGSPPTIDALAESAALLRELKANPDNSPDAVLWPRVCTILLKQAVSPGP